VCTAIVAFAVLGCEPLEPVDPGQTRVEVWLTDAASAYLDVAEVDIGEVGLVPLEGSAVSLTADGSGPVDLMELRTRDPLQLAEQDVAPDAYSTLTIEIESARVELDPDYAFTDGTRDSILAVPDGARNGVALNLDLAGVQDDSVGAMVIDAGRLVFMVDFDVNQSFLIQGDPEDPEGIQDMTFSPALRVVVQSVAGSIAGTVSSLAAAVSEAGRLVTARPLDEGILEPYQTQTATATTAPDGSYTLPFLPAGSYVVNVDVPDGYTTDPSLTEARVDVSTDVTGVDFLIRSDGGT
jgi:hypothetical protein